MRSTRRILAALLVVALSSVGIGSSAGSASAAGTPDHIRVAFPVVPRAGETIDFFVALFDDENNPLYEVTAQTAFTITGPENFSSASITPTIAGDYTVAGTYQGFGFSTSFHLHPTDFDHIAISPDAVTVSAGTLQAFSVSAYDLYGNFIETIGAQNNMVAGGDSGTNGDLFFASAGTRTVTATYAGTTATSTVTVIAGPAEFFGLNPATRKAGPGSTIAYTLGGFDHYGNAAGDHTSSATFESTNPTDVVVGNEVTATDPGVRTITAHRSGMDYTATLDIGTGPPTSIVITATDAVTTAGDYDRFTVEGTDEYGNVTDLSSAVTFSSNVSSDVLDSVFYYQVFKAGTHTITATYGALSDSVDIQVDPAGFWEFVVTDATGGPVVAGQSRTFGSALVDRWGNVIDAIGAGATYSSDEPSDVVGVGGLITFTKAGTRTISADWFSYMGYPVAGEIQVTVVADAAHPASLTLHPSSTTADQFGTVTVTVDGVDAYGNPLSGLEHDVTLTSDHPTDVIVGNTVTFPHASPHVITVTLGQASASFVVEVSPAQLATTGTNDAPLLAGGLLLVLLGVGLVLRRRFVS